MIKTAGLLICFALITVILGSGCVSNGAGTVTIVTNVSIDNSGNMDYSSTYSMPEATYDLLIKDINSKGYSTLRPYLLRDYSGSSQYFDETESLGNPTTITINSVAPVSMDNTPKPISVRIVNDNQVYFNDSTFSSNYFVSSADIQELDYSLTIPVKLDKGNYQTHSNDDYTAYWTFKNDPNIPELYAVSQVAGSNNVKPTPSPGFGVILTLFSLFSVGFIIYKYQN